MIWIIRQCEHVCSQRCRLPGEVEWAGGCVSLYGCREKVKVQVYRYREKDVLRETNNLINHFASGCHEAVCREKILNL